MSIKEDVHRIIDELPESDLEKVLHHSRWCGPRSAIHSFRC